MSSNPKEETINNIKKQNFQQIAFGGTTGKAARALGSLRAKNLEYFIVQYSDLKEDMFKIFLKNYHLNRDYTDTLMQVTEQGKILVIDPTHDSNIESKDYKNTPDLNSQKNVLEFNSFDEFMTYYKKNRVAPLLLDINSRQLDSAKKLLDSNTELEVTSSFNYIRTHYPEFVRNMKGGPNMEDIKKFTENFTKDLEELKSALNKNALNKSTPSFSSKAPTSFEISKKLRQEFASKYTFLFKEEWNYISTQKNNYGLIDTFFNWPDSYFIERFEDAQKMYDIFIKINDRIPFSLLVETKQFHRINDESINKLTQSELKDVTAAIRKEYPTLFNKSGAPIIYEIKFDNAESKNAHEILKKIEARNDELNRIEQMRGLGRPEEEIQEAMAELKKAKEAKLREQQLKPETKEEAPRPAITPQLQQKLQQKRSEASQPKVEEKKDTDQTSKPR